MRKLLYRLKLAWRVFRDGLPLESRRLRDARRAAREAGALADARLRTLEKRTAQLHRARRLIPNETDEQARYIYRGERR